MRTIWKALSFLAVVNLLALIIVMIWLWQSGRLTAERASDIRAMLSTTADQATQEAGRLATEAEAQRLSELQEQLRQHPPADSATQIMQIALVHQQREESIRRLDDERRMLAAQLQDATARMEAGAEAMRRQQDSNQDDRADQQQRKKDEQFLRAVKQLEQVPAKQAKKILEVLVSENNMDRAVAYLDSMNPRSAAKILREFKTDPEIELATELLERLRTHGVAGATSAPAGASPASGVASLARPSDRQDPSNAAASAAARAQPVDDPAAQ